ncbi:unnamed protein product [Owenia fusiformis]|uniref:Uncharacterized protein n=1 Tax=Owenia fusiformis TaxID=6347 RepID=A0A8J1U3E1_OWEFU|nr:unnamed protein product [Owenia fusiformis]
MDARTFDLYYSPVVIAFGVIGNILSVFIMTRSRNRNKSLCVYMTALAVVDFSQNLAWLTQWIFRSASETNLVTLLFCQVWIYSVSLLGEASIWTVVCMTVDRFLAVLFPMQSRTWCSSKRAKIVLSVLYPLLAIRIFHMPFTTYVIKDSDGIPEDCGVYDPDVEYNYYFGTISPWMDTFIESILPPLFLITFNTSIIISIRHNKRQRTNNLGSTPTISSHRENQMTAVLLIVSLSVLILTLPFNVVIMLETFGAIGDNLSQESFTTLYIVTNRIWFTNSAMNFYLYVACGRRFREDLTKCACCIGLFKQSSASSDPSSSDSNTNIFVTLKRNMTLKSSDRSSSLVSSSEASPNPSCEKHYVTYENGSVLSVNNSTNGSYGPSQFKFHDNSNIKSNRSDSTKRPLKGMKSISKHTRGASPVQIALVAYSRRSSS